MNAAEVSGRRMFLAWWGLMFSWIVFYFAARMLLKHVEMETWQRVTVAVVPVAPFALFLVTHVRHVRSMDELQRRIHLEALAVAFPLTMLLLMTLGLLQRAIDLPFEDWSYAHVWIYLPIFYALGLALSMRRYS